MRTITRRGFLRTAGAGVASLAAGRLASAQGAGRPNVLFLAVDDLNDWIGCLGGHPDTITPNLDRLAARGMLFTNAHCAAPLCNASRAALMTGRRPSSSGVYSNAQPWRPVMAEVVTMPQHFTAAGYRVTGGGKIYHFQDAASWQDYFPDLKHLKPKDPLPPGRPLNGIPNAAQFDWGPVDVPDDQMSDWQVAEWAAGELGKESARPFFLGCGFFRPHLPWYVPPRYFAKFPPERVTLPEVRKDDLDDVPEIGRKIALASGDHEKVLKAGNWRQAVSGYLAAINFADACLGRVLDALDSGPHARNTIVVLWGDHGWHLGEKLHWRKFTLWEEATRCPLMIAGPGIKPGVCSRPVSLMDIFPTLIDRCGLPARSDVEGLTLTPQLADPTTPRPVPALTTYKLGNHSIRDERWRYIRYVDGSEELYDHGSDQMEWTNLAGDAKYDEVKRKLGAFMPTTNAPNAPVLKKGGEE